MSTKPCLTAYIDSDWHYYVPDTGDLEDSLIPLGYPYEFVCERVWMRETTGAAAKADFEWEEIETLTRDERGRFAATRYWIECREDTPGAEPWYGVRYA